MENYEIKYRNVRILSNQFNIFFHKRIYRYESGIILYVVIKYYHTVCCENWCYYEKI